MFKDLMSYIYELLCLSMSRSKSFSGFDLPVTSVNVIIAFLVARRFHGRSELEFINESDKILSGLGFLLLFALIYFLIWFVLLGPFYLYRKYKPKKSPKLPISIEFKQGSLGHSDITEPRHTRSKFFGEISSDFNTKTLIDFELRHTAISKSGHTTLQRHDCTGGFYVSPVDNQIMCILNIKIRHNQFGSHEEYEKYNSEDVFENQTRYIVSAETEFCDDILIEFGMAKQAHELEFVFSKEGYLPIIKKFYVGPNGMLRSFEPDWWPEKKPYPSIR